MIRKLALAVCTFLLSGTAMAGFRVGNGGNVIVCQESTFSLDLYEGASLKNLHYQKQDLFWKDILIQKIQKLSAIQTPSQDTFLKWLAEFDQDVNFVHAQLGTTHDSDHILIPENCEVVQAVNQQFYPLPGEKRYLISDILWNQLANWDKAALVLHELAYRYLQQDTSIQARAFTALMFSREVDKLSASELQKKMNGFGF